MCGKGLIALEPSFDVLMMCRILYFPIVHNKNVVTCGIKWMNKFNDER